MHRGEVVLHFSLVIQWYVVLLGFLNFAEDGIDKVIMLMAIGPHGSDFQQHQVQWDPSFEASLPCVCCYSNSG